MNEQLLHTLQTDVIDLLKELIATPSFSKEEDQTAGILCRFLGLRGIEHTRIVNNIFALNKFYDASKPTILLNSHHDTVRPNKGYTIDPFFPIEKEGKLFGLGSNDAGGALVALMGTFLYYNDQPGLKYNLALAASAEEEISGREGIERILPDLTNIAFGIVGEPTKMQMAIAEKGLLVLDCVAHGQAGHAARDEGVNAIYKAIDDIAWFNTHKFSKVSDLLGPVKMSITVISTENKAHNVVPPQCTYVADVRVNELYTFEEILEEIRKNVKSEVTPRSLRMRSSMIPVDHELVRSGLKVGSDYYGSPTTSDKALMPFPALKIGPGDSARSHTADEYIYIDEIKTGLSTYIQLLENVLH
jgi:acetylornithine deacetylase